MDAVPVPPLTEEQESLLNKLTRFDQRMALYMVQGMNQRDAYIKAGGKAKGDNANSVSSRKSTKVNFKKFIDTMQKAAAARALCTTEDIVRAFMAECGLGLDEKGKPRQKPPDTTQSARVSALKALSNFTGGFDKNSQKVEHSGYIPISDEELYGPP